MSNVKPDAYSGCGFGQEFYKIIIFLL